MPIALTPSQIKMVALRAERHLAQAIASSGTLGTETRAIARASHLAVHEAIISLLKIYRDQVPGTGDIATRMAREYAIGADAEAGVPTLQCVRAILALARLARCQAGLDAE